MTETLHFTAGDGARIAYRLDGPEGRPVLVLSSSIATTLHMWDGQVAELAQSFRVLRYDFRGHGGSDAPAGAYSLNRLGRDVLELLDSLEIAHVHFLGLSLGGFVGQWLGIHAPERIERLILSNTSPFLGPASYFDEQIRNVLRRATFRPRLICSCATGFRPLCLPGRTRRSRNSAPRSLRCHRKAWRDASLRCATPTCAGRFR